MCISLSTIHLLKTRILSFSWKASDRRVFSMTAEICKVMILMNAKVTKIISSAALGHHFNLCFVIISHGFKPISWFKINDRSTNFFLILTPALRTKVFVQFKCLQEFLSRWRNKIFSINNRKTWFLQLKAVKNYTQNGRSRSALLCMLL